jgi:NAD(P)H-hydrate epimerase
MKIFKTSQIRKIDDYTIKNEPVASSGLMERAADQVRKWYISNFDRSKRVLVFTGPGNNGGDGLAVARLLFLNRYIVEVYHIKLSERTSDDWSFNFQRLKKETSIPFSTIEDIDQFPLITSEDVVIDAIFGSGLTRPAEGISAMVINKLNQIAGIIVSLDIPSGLYGEDNSNNNPENIIRASHTLSFEFPKLCFMFAENEEYVGEWNILPIGLSRNAIRNTPTSYHYLDKDYIIPLLKRRSKFDHKGMFGHGYLIAGSYGKIGASVLCARAALKTGLGLLTCHVPECGYQILQTCVPEAMVHIDENITNFSETEIPGSFDATGIGPGLGTHDVTQVAFRSLILKLTGPIVIDADGINILGINKNWLNDLPGMTILTPHIREFERIAGKSENSYNLMQKQLQFADRYNCILVIKGAHTSIAMPGGKIFFNSTGNPGMATAGSGDVLTGMILSLLAQDYSPEDASIIGVYLHGLAGDIAAAKSGYESLIASDIIDNIGNAFLEIRKII